MFIIYNFCKKELMVDQYFDWMNDFYNESPNWIINNSIDNKKRTISWLKLNDNEKKKLLDNDLNSNITYDGEI